MAYASATSPRLQGCKIVYKLDSSHVEYLSVGFCIHDAEKS